MVPIKLVFHIVYILTSLQKSFANKVVNIKLPKTKLSKIKELDGYPGRLVRPLMKVGLPLIKNVLLPLTKSALIQLGLIAAAAEGIHKKVSGSGASGSGITTLTISNEKMTDILKIVKSLKDSGLSNSLFF